MRHEEHVEREFRAQIEQPVHAVGSEHVRNLVRIGHDCGGPHWQDQPRKLVDEQLRRLDVDVSIDKSRDD